MIVVSTSNITGHLGPGGLLRGRVAGLIGGKVVGHCALARETPNHRIGAPASDQIPPMLLELRQPHESEEIPPAADDAGRETTLNQSLNAQVGHIKIFGIDACVFRFPRMSGLICSPGIESRHIWI